MNRKNHKVSTKAEQLADTFEAMPQAMAADITRHVAAEFERGNTENAYLCLHGLKISFPVMADELGVLETLMDLALGIPAPEVF